MSKEVHIIQLVGDATDLRRALDNVDRELASVAKQADRAQAALGPGLAKGTEVYAKGARRGASAVNQFTNAQRQQLRVGRQMRANYQNLGFQLQDIVVQMEMGTHWTRVMGQQGSQILGIFGNPLLTVLGAAGAAVLGLAKAMGVFSSETITLENHVESLTEALERLDQIQNKELKNNSLLAQIQRGELANQLRIVNELFANIGREIELQVATQRFVTDMMGKLAQVNNLRASSNGDDQTKLANVISLMEKDLGMSVQHVERFLSLVKQTGSDSLEGQVEALTELEKILFDMRGQGEEYYETWLNVLQVLNTHASELERQRQLQRDMMSDFTTMEQEATDKANERLETERQRLLAQAEGMALFRAMQAEALAIEEAESDRAYWQEYTNGLLAQQQLYYTAAKEEAYELEAATRAAVAALATYDLAVAQLNRATNGGPDAARSSSQTGEAGRNVIQILDRWERQSGGGGGASKITRQIDEISDALREQESLWNMVGSTANDNLMSMLESGESFEKAMVGYLRNVVAELFKVLVLQRLIGGVSINDGGELVGTGLIGNLLDRVTPNAKGNAFSQGNVIPFAKGGVVSGPTVFPMTNGTGLMGEAGPEAIVPLQRDAAGNLGVSASPVNVIVENNSGQPAEVRQEGNDLRVVIGAVQSEFTRQMATGQGAFPRALEMGYNTRRKAT